MATYQPTTVPRPFDHLSISTSSSSTTTSPTSPTATSTHDEQETDASSDSDDGGVFFGARNPLEAQVVAKLSHPPAQPLVSRSRRSSLITRLRKRDSREFLRRKTLLLPAREEQAEAEVETKGKRWEGSLFDERKSQGSASDDSSSPCPSPLNRLRMHSTPIQEHPFQSSAELAEDHCDLTFNMAGFHLSDSPSLPRPSISHRNLFSAEDNDPSAEKSPSATHSSEAEESESDGASEGDESDKENAVLVLDTSMTSFEQEEQPVMAEGAVTMGLSAAHEDMYGDEVDGLDMGGLKISDFADPDYEKVGSAAAYQEEGLDFEESDDEEDCQGSPTVTGTALALSGSPVSKHEVPARCLTPSPTREFDSESTASSPINFDSPLPLARAGPVVIPTFPALHPVDRGLDVQARSPVSTIPDQAFNVEPHSEIIETSMFTPPLAPRLPPRIPQSACTPSISRLHHHAVEASARQSRIMKSSAVDRAKPRSPVKEAARALVIRGQLDAALAPQTGNLGLPLRTVSSTSSSGNTSQDPQRADPPVSVAKAACSTQKTQGPIPSLPTSISKPFASASKQSTSVARSKESPARKMKVAPISGLGLVRPAKVFPFSAPRSHPSPAVHQPTLARSLAAPRQVLGARSMAPPPQRPIAALIKASQASIPAKRPLHAPSTGLMRTTVSVFGAGRPTMGLPSRIGINRDLGHSQSLPNFSGFVPTARPTGPMGSRSPAKFGVLGKRGFEGTARGMGTPMSARTIKLGTPSRPGGYSPKKLTQPVLLAPPVEATPELEVNGDAPTAAGPVAVSTGPPSAGTRQASPKATASSPSHPTQEASAKELSADVEDISMELPPAVSSSEPASSSPISKPNSKSSARARAKPTRDPSSTKERPKRTVKPPVDIVQNRYTAAMSEKELKTTTELNTVRNQVYFCAIERQIIKRNGERPPSPNSKLTSSFIERAISRGDRAKRRAGEEDTASELDVKPKEKEVRITHVRGAGDEEEYVSEREGASERPSKKMKLEGTAKTRMVRWDKGLYSFPDEEVEGEDEDRGGESTASGNSDASKSCLKDKSRLQLDHHGNVPDATRPVEKLKRSRIVVTAVYYEGEEPAPARGGNTPATTRRSKSKK
ncbi:hypothetical protein P7C73_g872, partial [Tremellales sp. Uapishka_1]